MSGPEREMRIMLGDKLDSRLRRGERFVHVKALPWGMFDPVVSERQAQENHGQTLAALNGRGGLDATEALAVLSASRWQNLDPEYAHRILYAMRALYRRVPPALPSSESDAPHPVGEVVER